VSGSSVRGGATTVPLQYEIPARIALRQNSRHLLVIYGKLIKSPVNTITICHARRLRQANFRRLFAGYYFSGHISLGPEPPRWQETAAGWGRQLPAAPVAKDGTVLLPAAVPHLQGLLAVAKLVIVGQKQSWLGVATAFTSLHLQAEEWPLRSQPRD
jgi:hypothetical protein